MPPKLSGPRPIDGAAAAGRRPRRREPVPGNVWKIAVEPGARVSAGETLVDRRVDEDGDRRLRAVGGMVHELCCAEGRAVALGQLLVIDGGLKRS